MPPEPVTSGAHEEARIDLAVTGSNASTLIIDWSGDDDPKNPVNWPKTRKWMVTGFSCFSCFMVGLNALSISSAAGEINERFGISDESFPNSYWTVTAWNGGATIFPLVILPLLEDFSVRIGYLTSFAVFTAFVIPQAVAQNYATLIVTRFFAGGCASVVQNAVANISGDLWVGEESSLPITLFITAYLLGFTLGPVVGAAIASRLYWRWIFYIELILYGVMLIPAYIFMKETRGKILLQKRARGYLKETGKRAKVAGDNKTTLGRLLYESTVRPLYLFVSEPVVFFFTLWSGFTVGNIFIATQSILQVYETNYGFTEVQVGYVQSSLVIGEVIGVGFCIWQNHIYSKSKAKNKSTPGVPIPEARLTISIPGSFIFLGGGLFIYAWTSYPEIHWIAPTIGLGIVGIGIMIVVHAAAIYITDAYQIWSGSAIAALASFENLCSAFLPLSAQSMYRDLGFRWASSLLAFIALALSFAPLVLYIKGEQIRKRSKWMANI